MTHRSVLHLAAILVAAVFAGASAASCGASPSSENAPCSPRSASAPPTKAIPASITTKVVAHGQTVCIVGSGFGSRLGHIVFSGASPPLPGRVLSWTNDAVAVVLPDGAATGPVEGQTATGVPFYAGPVVVLGSANGVAAVHAGGHDAVLSGQSASVSVGAVDSRGKPVANASVVVTDGLGTLSCRTDGQGHCSVSVTAFRTETLVVFSGTAWTQATVRVTQPPDERMTLSASSADLVDGESAGITAVVRTAAGQPVPNAEVNFNSTGEHVVLNPAKAFTDATGSARTTASSALPALGIIEAVSNDSATTAVVQVMWSTSVVTDISPTAGPARTSVTLQGRGFTPGALVYFGKNEATSVTVVDPATLIAVAPSGSGAVGVQVQIDGTYSDLLTAPQYTYT